MLFRPTPLCCIHSGKPIHTQSMSGTLLNDAICTPCDEVEAQGMMACCCLCRFALVRSYGQLQQPDLAAKAFDECWRLGHWTPRDVKTANALLNALHMDLNATYDRYCSTAVICASTWLLKVNPFMSCPASLVHDKCNFSYATSSSPPNDCYSGPR